MPSTIDATKPRNGDSTPQREIRDQLAAAKADFATIEHQGVCAVGVVDFSAASEAAVTITIGGVAYLEADTADAPNGVWTNGASAADSATSFAAAVNGDTRAAGVALGITAVVSSEGDSVVLCADAVGTAGNYAVSEDSATNVTVENMHGGEAAGLKKVARIKYTVTAQDVKADEVNIPLDFTPSVVVAYHVDTNGAENTHTANTTVESSPTRVRVNFAGATDLVAGDVLYVIAYQ